MTVINTNVAAQVTANAMKTNSKHMETTMERLATGFRINSAGDDAAGLGIGSKMTSQIRGLDQAVRNANDAISMLQTADGASVEISDMLQRMRELAVQAKNGTNSSNDLVNLNKEFAQLANEIERVADKTTFNGQNVLNGLGAVTFNVGHGTSDTMSFTFRDFEMDQGSTAGVSGVHTLAVTAATFNAFGATDEMLITNSAGDTVIVDVAAIGTAGGTNLTDATYTELIAAINTQIGAATGFEGMAAANNGASTAITFTQDTAGTGDVLTIQRKTAAGVLTDFGTLTTTTVGSAAGGDGNPMAANISDFQTAGSQAQASTTLAELDAAITGVDKARADFGAVINRLEYTVDNLNSIAQNTRAARSAVMDADYAAETTELARTQIISQASTAMLSQANQQAQSVLALLK
jgi:flagellin